MSVEDLVPSASGDSDRNSQVYRSTNPIIRQWRGEYSLAIAYWFVFVFGSILAIGAIFTVGVIFSAERGYDPGLNFWLLAVTWTILFGVTVWQVVGTWRSATNHAVRQISANKATSWATAAKIVLVLGVVRMIADFSLSGAPQLAETYDMAFRGDPRVPAYALRIMRNGTEIEVTGGFRFGLAADFERLVAASPRIRVVHLTSNGGRVGEAEKLGKAIRLRGLITYVPAHCESACTLAFAAGRERWIAKGGQLGFHGPSFPGMMTFDREASVRAWKAEYLAAGFAQAFVDRALAAPNTEMWRPGIPELMAAKAVTNVSDGSQFAASGYEPGITQETLAALLAQHVRQFAAVRVKQPEDYQRISKVYYQGYLDGMTERELTSWFRAQLQPITRFHVARADDAVLIDLGRLGTEQLVALGRTDPTLCYQHAAGIGNVDVSGSLPQTLVEREGVLEERAILTSAPRAEAAPGIADALVLKITAASLKRFSPEQAANFLFSSGSPANHGDYCTMVVTIYQEVLALPPDEAVTVLRYFATKSLNK
jgi:hypothetical protein